MDGRIILWAVCSGSGSQYGRPARLPASVVPAGVYPSPIKGNAGQASPQQPFFAIGAHIFQKQITKHPIMDIPAFQTVHTGRHTRIIIFITTRIGQVHLCQGQAQRLRLCCRDFPMRAVNSDPVEHFVKGRDKADQFNIGALADGLQGKGAILARGPDITAGFLFMIMSL